MWKTKKFRHDFICLFIFYVKSAFYSVFNRSISPIVWILFIPKVAKLFFCFYFVALLDNLYFKLAVQDMICLKCARRGQHWVTNLSQQPISICWDCVNAYLSPWVVSTCLLHSRQVWKLGNVRIHVWQQVQCSMSI